jgi:monoglucosyldiacylglycerol epimerase
MPAWIAESWEPLARLLLQAGALFVVATFVFDTIHHVLHLCLNSRHRWLRRLARPHLAHHVFFDRRLRHHDEVIVPNLLHHVIPEYATQMVVCAIGFTVLDPRAVGLVMAGFTVLFGSAMIMRGKDFYHLPTPRVPVAHGTLLVRPQYHALHHVYPDSYISSYTTLFDRLMGTACHIRGRRVALTGASGAFGSAMKGLLEKAGAVVVPLKFGVDYTYEDYSGADAALEAADILVLAHGAKGERAMQANCDSFLALIDRFKRHAQHRQLPGEVWAVGSEIECHPAFGVADLRSYARSKRAFARAAAHLMQDRDVLYRHIVPSAFRSRMGPGLMSGRAAAAIAFWLIRRGFRYVPVTYTGVAFLNYIPFCFRGLIADLQAPRRRGASVPVSSTTG